MSLIGLIVNLIAGEIMRVEDVIEDLEKAKSKLDDLRLESEENEKYDLVEALEGYIEDIQSIIDALTDDEFFVLKPADANSVIFN